MTIPSAGTLFAGRYRIESVLGRGGMGVVLAANDEKTSVDCAVKLLSAPELDQDRARLVREARALMLITNPHVVRVFDVGEDDDGHPYLVLERLQGEDLGKVAPRGQPLSPDVVVDYATQACEALAAAHAIDIIHRDIKLSNLFLTRGADGKRVLKVLDFGISKVSGDGQGTLTNTDGPLGSPQFISPEQLEDPRTVDAHTDIWALGVVMYRLLSGALPFEGKTITETFALVAGGARRPLAEAAPATPPALAAIVERCLERDPLRRFPSAAALKDALAGRLDPGDVADTAVTTTRPVHDDEAAIPTVTIHTTAEASAPPPRSRRSRLAAFGVGAAAALGVGILAISWRGSTDSTREPAASPSASTTVEDASAPTANIELAAPSASAPHTVPKPRPHPHRAPAPSSSSPPPELRGNPYR